jgi:hypothetical protein
VEQLRDAVVGRAEPVRRGGVELGDLAGPQHAVVVADDQSELTGPRRATRSRGG